MSQEKELVKCLNKEIESLRLRIQLYEKKVRELQNELDKNKRTAA